MKSTINDLKNVIRQYNKDNPQNKILFSKLNKAQLLDAVNTINSEQRKEEPNIRKTKERQKKEINIDAPLHENDDLDFIGYTRLPKYKIVQYIQEFRPDLPRTFFNKPIRELVDYIKNYFKRSEIRHIDFFNKYISPYTSVPFEKKLGLERLQLGELTEQEKNEYDYSPYNMGTQPIQIGHEKIILQEHQKKFIEGFLLGNLRSAIVFHGVGTGKTFTAVACSKFYLQLYPKNKVIVVTPTAVLFNFIESMASYGIDPRDTRYKYYSYAKYANSGISAQNALLIVDEAHNFRTEMDISRDPLDHTKYAFGRSNKLGQKLFAKGGVPADKVLLLTATPFVNMPYDVENLLALGSGSLPNDKKTFGMIVSNNNNVKDYFDYRISHFEKGTNNKFFPDRREKYISFVVDKNNEDKIRAKISYDKNAFYGNSRQFSVEVDGKKFNFIMDEIKKYNDKKFVIYVTFQQSGVNPLSEMLHKANIPFGLVTGRQNTMEKARAIDGYNNFENDKYLDKRNRVLIITRAGSEGVNLKRTRGIFIVDGQWNDALFEQIVARAIRFKSHFDLPLKEQYVDVYKLFVCYENEKKILDGLNSGKKFDFERFLQNVQLFRAEQKKSEKGSGGFILDGIDYDIPTEKVSKRGFIDYYIENGRHAEFKKLYEQLFINTEEIYEEVNKILKINFEELLDLFNYINMSIIALENDDFDNDILEKLKKGSYERNEYIKHQLRFGKDKHKYATQDIINAIGVNSLPSTDFYMFVLQKNKEKIINAFINIIDKDAEPVENAITKLPANKILYDIINDKTLDSDQLMKTLINILRPKVGQSINIIKKNVVNGQNVLDKFIQKRADINKLKKDRLRARVRQEFFTPSHYVDQLIEFSNIKKANKNKLYRILEPSAGYGNIVQGLLSVMNKNKIMIKIDMVEIVEENREELKKIENLIPDVVKLMAQPNFLEFEVAEKYDYVFMNPPFHLEKRLHKELDRDYYDIDFVRRAYAMLDNGGRLVAITGQSWMKMGGYKKWLKSVNAELINKTVTDWSGDGKYDVATNIKKLDLTFIHIYKNYNKEETLNILGNDETILKETRIPTKINKSIVEIPQQLTPNEANIELIERLEHNERQPKTRPRPKPRRKPRRKS
jgi:16S rRNA G966 N2-methylase RsmD